MKILLLCHSLGIGGTERQIVAIAKGLRERGQEVAVGMFYTNGQFDAELHENGISILDLNKGGRRDVLGFFFRSVRTVWKFRPTIIYAFLNTPNILAILIRPFTPRYKIVWGVRASHVDLSRYDYLFRFAYLIEYKFSRFADLIICNSRAGLEYAVARGFPRERSISIPNGIDTEVFKPDASMRARVRSEWGVQEGEKLFGLVARLDPMKDHSAFFHAAAMLLRERADVRFVCVGDGPELYKAELRRTASELGLDQKLIWTGERRDMPAVFNAFDVGVSSSYGEGFSNTIAEAMACGVPCVVTDVGDSALIVADGGEVVAPQNPGDLCNGFRLILGKLGPDIRNATRASIIARFTNGVLVQKTLQALCNLI